MTRDAVRVVAVAWDHPDAVALRAAASAELDDRYADRLAHAGMAAALAVAEDSVAYTGLAVDATGTAVGHCVLRWRGPDLELKRMYVAPLARGRAVPEGRLHADPGVPAVRPAAVLAVLRQSRHHSSRRRDDTTPVLKPARCRPPANRACSIFTHRFITT